MESLGATAHIAIQTEHLEGGGGTTWMRMTLSFRQSRYTWKKWNGRHDQFPQARGGLSREG